MKNKNKPSDKRDSSNYVSEPSIVYVKKQSEKEATIPTGYVSLKEGMDRVRNYVKSLYE
ncbi:MAG: hypothetical protein Q4G63_03990 [Bacteroidia bacterium]|nr:hypothetical protein [Bacteroidia bacterium]